MCLIVSLEICGVVCCLLRWFRECGGEFEMIEEGENKRARLGGDLKGFKFALLTQS